jgi:hypothetical protein
MPRSSPRKRGSIVSLQLGTGSLLSRGTSGIIAAHPILRFKFRLSSRAGVRRRPCSWRRGGTGRMSGLPDIRNAKTLWPRRCGAWLPYPLDHEGTARRSAQPFLKCAPCCQGAAPLGAPSRRLPVPGRACRWPHVVPPPARFSRRLKGQPLLPSLGRTFTATVSELLAGGHNAPGRSPGAARARGPRLSSPAGAAPAVSGFPAAALKGCAPVLRRRILPVAPSSKRLAKTPLTEQGEVGCRGGSRRESEFIPRKFSMWTIALGVQNDIG